ncbi:extracellular solute-binding protein [Paenibacillus aestuarii]|uniref:Extracellular solute-binding protein n=1 Tax=Paenibacillus aestuarii TaxID=516965 RepID=A0ABW0K788_9BACL|nr:extracellular solute-binding protein [Paenibacillus aestuarii]
MKKTMTVLSVGIMSLALIVGCTKAPDNASGSKDDSAAGNSAATSDQAAAPMKEKTFKFLNNSHPSWPYNKDWLVWKLLKEKTGVNLDVEVPSGELSDAFNLAIASGNPPELLTSPDKQTADKYGQEGALVNYLDYVKKDMPNYDKWMKEHPTETQNVMSADGKMYIVPNSGIGETNRMHWMFRKDIFKKNNLQEPKNWDELYDVLKKLKAQYPDSYPFAFRDGLLYLRNLAPAFGTQYDFYYDFDKKDWHYGPIEDNYKTMIAYMAKFLKEGLIPPDFLSIDTKQWQDLMSTNKTFMTVDYIGRIDFYNKPLRKDNPDFDLEFMPPPAGGPNGKQLNEFTQYEEMNFVVSSKSKQIDDIMKFIDFFFSEEGKTLVSWGKEGVTYKVENGKKSFIENYTDVSDMRKKTGLSTDGAYIWFDYDAHISLASPEAKYAYHEAPKYDDKEQPRPAFTEDEMEVIKTTGQEIAKYRDENIAKFILGNRSLDEWNQYVDGLKKLGLDKVLAIYKAAYERMQQFSSK